MLVVMVTGLAVASLLVVLLARRSKAARPKLSPDILARAAEAPCPSPADAPFIDVSWTGIAGIRLELCGGSPPSTLLVDPYLTRHSLPELFFPVDADSPTLARAFPRADFIVVGHTHHDHFADTPEIAKRTGATILGSRSTCNLAVAMGVAPAQCIAFEDQNPVQAGPWTIEAIPTPHALVWPGFVPFSGDVPPRPRDDRPWVWQLREGQMWSLIIRGAGKTLYHHGSAGLSDSQLRRVRGLQPDLAFVGIALRENTPDFEARLLEPLRAKSVMPVHHDNFFGPMLTDEGPLLSRINLPEFESRIGQYGAHLLVRKPFERVRVQ
ncbi:MAG: MBL fold metallo-hydrolase [Myxococcota bacterium]|nr:MBL fold metallo-hydrolase [Myxococcota bacterium]